MKLELVSFNLCPYVQRSVIVLRHKEVPFSVTHIDLADPPPWFKELSPLGKVPILKVDDTEVIFESSVINEFIDETTPEPMHPEDPLLRAKNRAWIEFVSECLGPLFLLATGPEDKFKMAAKILFDKLGKIEQVVGDGPYFNGKKLSLVDAAYAPFFMRLGMISDINTTLIPWIKFPKVADWSNNLLGLRVVKESAPSGFSMLYREFIKKKGGYLSTYL